MVKRKDSPAAKYITTSACGEGFLPESGQLITLLHNPRPLPRVIPLLYNEGAVKFPRGIIMPNFDSALQQLREERRGTQLRLEKLDQVISGIESLNGSSGVSSKPARPTRIVSAASRRKMALAQKARWASLRKESPAAVVGKATGSTPAKRTISATGKKRIAAAQRRRWARFRAGKK